MPTKTESKRTEIPKRMLQAIQHPNLIRREMFSRSFFAFFRHFWAEMNNDTLQLNWHLEFLCDVLQDMAEKVARGKNPGYDYLIINIPPGTTKSTIVSRMFPVWAWTQWYWMRFITSSYSSALSLELAEDSRDLLKSESFKAMYPEIGVKQDRDTKSNFKLLKKEWHRKGLQPRELKGGSRLSTSTGGSTTGFQGHILIVDDPLDPRRSSSGVELAKANRWLSETLSTRKIDKNITPTVLIMQRLHQSDCTGHLLETIDAENVKLISLPGELDNYGDEVRPIELKEYYQKGLLDPVRLNRKVLRKLYTQLGQYGYSGQIGQKPVPPGGGMFQVDKFQYADRTFGRPQLVKTVRYWDKAASSNSGAYTAGVKMARLNNGKAMVIDVKRGQWATHEREQMIRSTAEADGQGVDVYYEQEPGSGGKESAEATTRNLAGFVARPDPAKGDKVYRADPFSVQVNSGNVLLLRADWNHDFVEELRFFPFSTFKDQVDASSGAYAKLFSGKQVEVY